MKAFLNRISLILKNVGSVVVEFPAAVAFGFFFALIWSLTASQPRDSFVLSMVSCLLLGTVTNLIMPIIAYRLKVKDIWNLAFAGIGIVIPFGVFLLLYTNAQRPGFNVGLMCVGVFIIIECLFAIFLLMYKREGYSFGRITRCLLKNMAIGVFCGGIVFLVLALILALFGTVFLNQANSLYANALMVSLFVVFLFLLNAVSELINKREQTEDIFPDFMNRIVSYLVIPLVCIWFLYTIIWLVRGLWWNSWAGAGEIFSHIFPLCTVGYLVLMLTYAMEDRILFKFYRNAFTVGSIPLIIVGFWRLIELINLYGLTEKRYFAFLGFILLCIGQLLLIFSPKNSGLPVLITVAVLLVVSVLPGVNYQNVACYSQVQRAEKILYKNNMLSGDDISPPENISREDRIELSRAVEYICKYQKQSMAKWLPLDFSFQNDYHSVFGVTGEYDAQGNSTLTAKVLVGELETMYYNISPYDIALVNSTSYNLYNFSMDNIIGKNGVYSVKFTDYAEENITVATVTKDGVTVLEQEITYNLGDIAKYLENNVNSEYDTVYMPFNLMHIKLESKDVELLVVFKSVTMDKNEMDDDRLTTVLTDTILLKEN